MPKGKAVRRGGAQAGDAIVLTGVIGDAALGLKVLQERLDLKRYAKAVEAYHVPNPRVHLHEFMQGNVHAAADISDGLFADVMHIARASGLGACIDAKAITFSDVVNDGLRAKEITINQAMKGGDDYELILAISEASLAGALIELKKLQCNPLVIGKFSDITLGLNVENAQHYALDLEDLGWSHF